MTIHHTPLSHDDDDYSIENLLFTLDLARRSLPYGAHAVHYERIDLIKSIIQRSATNPPPPPPARTLSDILRPSEK